MTEPVRVPRGRRYREAHAKPDFTPSPEARERVRRAITSESVRQASGPSEPWVRTSERFADAAIAAFVEAEGLKEVSAEQWDWHGSQGTKRLVGPWRKRD